MSGHENELRKALAEDVPFDAQRGESEASRARRWFDTRLKRSGRIAWIRIIVVAAVFAAALARFNVAESTRAMIGYATLMVITMVLVSAICVQSWVAGVRIGLLREIKLLRLDCLCRPTEPVTQLDSEGFSNAGSTRWSLSVQEWIAWLVLLAVVASASQFMATWLSARQWPANMATFAGMPVTVEAPRLGSPIYYTIHINMEHGDCKVSGVTPERKQTELFSMGKGFVRHGFLPPGDALRLDPQGNKGTYSVRFE